MPGFRASLGNRQEDRGCTAMPFFHAGGCVLAVLGSIYAWLNDCILWSPLMHKR